MLQKTLLSVIAILLFQISFAQVNYVPGFVIKNNGDTLKGLIDYRNWSANPDRINFKMKAEDNPMLLHPTDVQEFHVMGEIYVSGIVQSNISPIKADQLDIHPQPKIEMVTTFLQTLIKGDKGLYYYKNPDGIKNFYIRQDTAFELLVHKKYLKPVNGKREIVQNNKYIGQLNIYLKDCQAISSKLNHATYKQNSLTSVFKSYYECSSSSFSYIKEKEKIKAEIGVLAGASLTKLDFVSTGQFYKYLTEAGYQPSTNITAGLYLDLIMPRHQEKWSVNNEILFSQYNVNGKIEAIESADSYKITSTEIGYSYLKMNNMLRYKYPINKVSIFFNGGISNGIALHEKNYKKEETKFYSRQEVTESRAIDETRPYEQGYILGTGLKYKAFSLEMRFENGWGMSKYQGLESSADRYFLLLGYRINHKKK